LCAKVIAALAGTGPEASDGRTRNDSFADNASSAELAGHYVGALGTSVDVAPSAAGLDVCVRGSSPQPVARINLRRGQDGKLSAFSDTPHLTIGFFNPPASAVPALMVGLNAYRRAA